MTITVDVATETPRTGALVNATPIVTAHVGAGSGIKGVLISFTHGIGITDYISAVKYGTDGSGAGGTAMSRIVRATIDATEDGATEWWFLGTGVAQGSTNYAYTPTASVNDDVQQVCITLLGDSDLEVIDFDTASTTGANPSITLQNSAKTGTSAMAFGALYSSVNAVGGTTEGSNCTLLFEEDQGNFVAHTLRQTTAQTGTGDFVIGVTVVSGDYAFAALTVAEKSAGLPLAIDTAGAVTLAGQSIAAATDVALSTGALSLAGQAITANVGLAVSQGALTVSGQTIDTQLALGLSIEVGGLTIAGQSVAAEVDVALSSGGLTLAGQTITYAWTVPWTEGAITLAGQTLTTQLGGSLELSIEVGALTIAGQGIAANTDVALDSGALTVAGQSLETQLGAGLALSIEAGSLTVSGQTLDTALDVDQALSIEAGAIGISGQAQTVSLTLVASNGELTLAGQQLVAGLGVNVSAGVVGIAGSSVDPSLEIDIFPWVILDHVDPRDRFDVIDEQVA
jgi:hypothetical protein